MGALAGPHPTLGAKLQLVDSSCTGHKSVSKLHCVYGDGGLAIMTVLELRAEKTLRSDEEEGEKRINI